MKREELLKIYSAYLPYGLKVKFINPYDSNPIDVLVSVCVDEETQRLDNIPILNGKRYYANDVDGAKPILRPLSDLTEEIDHEGLKFIPIEYFKYDPVDYFEDTDHFEYLHSWLASQDKSHHVMFLPYGLINQLIKWKFNVFNLQEDQYVQVTKEFNPYK